MTVQLALTQLSELNAQNTKYNKKFDEARQRVDSIIQQIHCDKISQQEDTKLRLQKSLQYTREITGLLQNDINQKADMYRNLSEDQVDSMQLSPRSSLSFNRTPSNYQFPKPSKTNFRDLRKKTGLVDSNLFNKMYKDKVSGKGDETGQLQLTDLYDIINKQRKKSQELNNIMDNIQVEYKLKNQTDDHEQDKNTFSID